jgi:hypothetical protein
MNPWLDQALVAAIVGGALGWFVWGFVRRRTSGKDCGSGCGCGSKKPGGEVR